MLARLTEPVLHLLVRQVQLLGYAADLQTVVDVQAVDLAARLRQPRQRPFHALDKQPGVDHRLRFRTVGVQADVVLIFLADPAPPVVVADGMARHGADQTRQCLAADELCAAEQTQEDVLHHVLSLVGIMYAHRNKTYGFIAMLHVIEGDDFASIH